MVRYWKIIGSVAFGGILVYSVGLTTLYHLSLRSSIPILSQVELESKLTEEAENMELDASTISARLGTWCRERQACVKKVGERYEITLEFDRNTAALRHELAHIALGHLESVGPNVILNRLRNLLYEPSADLYAVLGIRF